MGERSLLTFLEDDAGATAIEYGLIAALMVLVMIVGLNVLAEAMVDMYTGSDDSIRAVIDGTGTGSGGS